MLTEFRSVAEPAHLSPSVSDSPLAGQRVLVVEDNALIAFEVQALLTEAGCTVLGPCPTADLAMALIERVQIDCATVDLGLTRGAGSSVAFALERRAILFVIVTGQSPESLPASLRACTIVQKPYSALALLTAIRTSITF